MKLRIFGLTLFLAAATCVRGGTPAYVQCGTYDSYLLLYRSLDKFEELGKLRCSEKIEILAHVPGFYQVRVADGRVGWVIETDVSTTPPPPHNAFTFGMTEAPKPAPVPVAAKREAPAGALTNEDIIALHGNPAALAVMLDKMKSTPCDFDTSPLAIRRLRAAQVPDKVILAMLASPVAPEGSLDEAATTLSVRIPVDTGIELHVRHDVPGDGLLDGAVIDLTADEDLVVHGQLIIVKGATARARVLGLRGPGSMTHPGQVAWFLQDIATVQGGFVPAIFAAKQTGKLHPKFLDGYPFFLSTFDKGEVAIRSAHSEVRAVLVAGTVLQIPQRPAAGGPEMTAREQAPVAPKEEAAKPAELKPVAASAASASPTVTAAPAPATEAAATPPVAPPPTATAPTAAHKDASADPPAGAQSFAEPPSK